MGQTASSHRRRQTVLLGDFNQLESQVREDSDYVTLVRVTPSANDLSRHNDLIDLNIDRPPLRPTSALPNANRSNAGLNRRKTSFEPNIYSDLKDYLQPKTDSIANEIPIDQSLDESSLGLAPPPTGRPLSFANHCSSRCRCNDCRLARYHLLNWLLPNCTRTNAERLLMGRTDGTFLVRYDDSLTFASIACSQTFFCRKSEKFPNQYTLSFVCGQVIRHCLILRSVYGKNRSLINPFIGLEKREQTIKQWNSETLLAAINSQ